MNTYDTPTERAQGLLGAIAVYALLEAAVLKASWQQKKEVRLIRTIATLELVVCPKSRAIWKTVCRFMRTKGTWECDVHNGGES